MKRKSMVEPEEEDEEEDDDEAKAPEPVQKKKISAAEAQVTSMDFFPARAIHIFRFFVSVMIESKVDTSVSILIDTKIHIICVYCDYYNNCLRQKNWRKSVD